MDIALALGGGGVKGIAHVGVIHCLENAGYHIRAVAGTSAGGLIGGLYAAGYGPQEMERILLGIDQSRMFGRKREDGPSLLGLSGLKDLLSGLLDGKAFSDLKIPLAVTAVDVKTGQEIILHHGKVLEAIFASSAVPGVFPPVKIGAITLMDGGVLDPVPVSVARWLAPNLPIVAVALAAPPEEWTTQPPPSLPVPGPTQLIERVSRLRLAQAFNLFLQSIEYSSRLMAELRLETDQPDVVVRPEVAEVGWLDRVNVAELIERGDQAAQLGLPDLKKALSWSGQLGRRFRRAPSDQRLPAFKHDL